MKILFSGDIVIKHPHLFAISEKVKNIIDSHDVRCCNFEAPIYSGNNKTSAFLKTGPNICQTETSAETVIRAGFNLISIANNHIMDFGADALKNTIAFFDNKNIPVIGAGFSFESAYKAAIYPPSPHTHADKGKIGILALAQAEFGVYKSNKTICGYGWINHPDVPGIIAELRKEVSTLIIFAHAGIESEIIPLPEWQDCYRNLIHLGADLVIASHPHIVQGFEIYNGKYIFYSLGNFYLDFDGMENNIEWNRGILLSIDTDSIDSPEIIPISVNNSIIDIDDNQDFKDTISLRTSFVSDKNELEKKADLLAINLWNRYYRDYYINSIFKNYIYNLSIKKIIKYFLNFCLGKFGKKKDSDKINETLLLHNIQIESHRWLVERYLYNKNIETNGISRS
jgi:poly-gamma-glutamate synthesis protein (capsule biosynthesis protein)